MKNLYAFFLTFYFISAFAQCPSGDITLSSQAAVNTFAANYPTCTTISGTLMISGADITDLTPLIPINTITGSLVVYLCPSLQNLNGFNNVNTIGGSCDLSANNQLASVGGLENLTTVGNSFIISNAANLTNMNGLQALTSVGSLLSIKGTGITSFAGLDNLTSIGFFLEISNNPTLISLNELSNLTSIGGYIDMQNNPLLTTLSGLDNINPTSITAILIKNSPNLSFCSVQSFCTFLTQIGGGTFSNNATGCNSPSEITTICNLAVAQQETTEIAIYPNPVKDMLKLNIEKSSVISYTISETSGKEVIKAYGDNTTVDVSMLRAGIYILSITTSESTFHTKFIKQ